VIIYIFFYYVVFAVLDFLPVVTILATIISIFRKRLIKRTIAAIAVVPLIKVLININRHGYGPSESEFFLSELKEGSVWRFLALIGYFYLIYWWITLLRDLVEQGNEITRKLIKIGLATAFSINVIWFLISFF
jgi:hypothetical protein